MTRIGRRDMLLGTAVCLSGLRTTRADAGRQAAAPATSFELSAHGCGRATGYAETNKIVTIGDRTHVAWLDSADDRFIVRVRTLDRQTGRWSSPVSVGQAADNHGGPALTCDSHGFLHVVYHPHHHPFHYRRSRKPNDASAWTDPVVTFGQGCTYPTLLCGRDDTLYLTCREQTKSEWGVGLYAKPDGGDWERRGTVLRAMKRGYAHFQEALAWGNDPRTMHMSIRFYDSGRAHTIGYLGSVDAGRTWQRDDGTAVELPATAETVTNIVNERDREAPSLRCGAIATDAHGRPFVMYSAQEQPDALHRVWLAWKDGDGPWRRRAIDEISRFRPGWHAMMPGGLTFTPDGRLCATCTIAQNDAASATALWGHPTSEVAWLESNDGGESFSVRMLSRPDPETPHWLPNIERPTGHHAVDQPGVIYTAGTRGENNRQIVSNRVIWVRTDRA